RHENRLERAVLAPQALYDPEEERLRELAIAVGHAPRDVEHEEHDGVHGRLAPARELPEAQIFVREGRRGIGVAAPLDHLLEGSTPVETGTRAATIPSFAFPVALLGWADARLQVRQL